MPKQPTTLACFVLATFSLSCLSAERAADAPQENDEAIPASTELQIGKNLNERIALYTDFLAGIGGGV